ncbi:MAG: aminopeptidase [Myxococcota bacterium]|nr:aminopeptidase [Myxococcota bacterium]
MMKVNVAAACVAACVLGSGLAAAQPKKLEPAAAVDLAALAEKIVGKTANVVTGEIVQISTGPNDVALAEELAVAVRKRGAFALITLDSENLAKKSIASVPEQYDSQAPKLSLALAKLVNVEITIPAIRDPGIYAALPVARQAAQSKVGAQVAQLRVKRNVRRIEVGNGLAPSPSRAKELGVSEAELAKLFWDGVSADYGPIEAKATALKAVLAKGGELHITHPNGTDLTMKIRGRKVLTSDGVLSDADKKAGGANVNVWLPAGEVYLSPVPGSVTGKVVDDRSSYMDKEVLGLTLEVKAGKITSVSAKSGWDAIQPRYDAAGPGKLELGVFDIGINPAVKTTPKLESFVSAGMVTLMTGNNVWAGGTNQEPFALVLHLPGTTVMLDGKPLIENGALK